MLEIMLTWMLYGDGKNRKNRYGGLIREYATTSKRLAEDTMEVFLKISNGATISIRIPEDRFIEGRLIKAENSQPLYIVHERTTKSITLDKRFTTTELVPYNDLVYCVTVPNNTWLMRYNDKISWTHNCDHPAEREIVEYKTASHRINKL